MANKISVQQASFSYGKKQVWSDVNLEVESGETICLLGPNGCGKTTLLNCIHGDLTLQSGSIKIDGRDISKMSVNRIARCMGYVFQDHAAPFPYTSLEVVKMGRTPHLKFLETPSRDDSRRARQIMEELGIGHLAAKRYTNISGGERQLVLIARTLCQEPEIILFDEPTSHLDFKNQATVLQTIDKLARKGLTIIMTSHFPNHAWLLSSKVAMMGYGGFIEIGLAEQVMTEANLSQTYGINVKVYQGVSGSSKINYCAPEYSWAANRAIG